MKMTSFLKFAVPVFIVSFIAFCVLSYCVVTGLTLPFDEAVLHAINGASHTAFDTFFMMYTELAGSIAVAIITTVLFGIYIYKRRYTRATFIALAVGGSALITYGLKLTFERTRPDLWEWIITETQFSFPSGHATASAALALVFVILLWETKWRVAAIIAGILYVFLIGLSRMYLGVHFPTDILGGWLVAVCWTTLLLMGIYLYQRHSLKKLQLQS